MANTIGIGIGIVFDSPHGVPAPAPLPLLPVMVTPIDAQSQVWDLGSNMYRCELQYPVDSGSGIRFNFALAALIPNKHYRCDFNIDTIDTLDGVDHLMADVCDDPDLGPFFQGPVSFTFTRASYDASYRFVDVSDPFPDKYCEFIISGMKLTQLD